MLLFRKHKKTRKLIIELTSLGSRGGHTDVDEWEKVEKRRPFPLA